MNKVTRVVAMLGFLLFLAVGVFGGGVQEEMPTLKVVTTTSLIEQIAERVGKDKVEVVNIIPPAQCPGHFDVKPGDIQKLADADLFFLHGWQGEQFSQQLISSVNNPELTVVRLDIEGNWMTPSVQQEAVEKITAVLVGADEGNRSYYEELSSAYKASITAKEMELRTRLDKLELSAVNVLCAEMQMGFVKWIGANVVAAYGRPDSLTPKVVRQLVDKGKAENVSLIIDNLQSGKDAGAAIAEELGCRRIILSNFPGGFEDTETWEKAIDTNIELIMEAITR